MDREKIKSKIEGFLEKQHYKYTSEDNDIINDLGMDSLDTVEYVLYVEKQFDITIPDYDAEDLITIAQMIKYVEDHMDSEQAICPKCMSIAYVRDLNDNAQYCYGLVCNKCADKVDREIDSAQQDKS